MQTFKHCFGRFQIQSVLVCILLAFLVTETSSATCLSNQFLDTTTNLCTDCAPGCTSCLTLGNCTACEPGLTRTRYAGNNFLCNCTVANQIYNKGSKLCGSCATAITHCNTCTSTASGNKCTNCDPGYYINNNIECLVCPTGCATCQSSTKCNTCITNYAMNGTLCYPIPCGTLMPFCVTCLYTPLACTLCDPGYFPSNTTCLPCGPNCLTCDASSCLSCSPGYAVLTPTCQACEIALFNPGCISCTNTECTQCVTSTVLDPITFYCNCPNYGESYFNGACQLCSLFYDPQCIRCNSTSCIDCEAGLFYNTVSKLCESLIDACGDGKWERFEACDDDNLVNGDGCNSLCQIEPDYECLRSQKLANGSSFCKYTRNFTISLQYIQKELTSNTAHLFYTIQPFTFQQWTTAELQNFLSPVEIVEKDTGLVKIVPFSSLSFGFRRIDGQNQLELTVDYGQNSIENAYVRFNLNKTATTLSAINTQPIQAKTYVRISSEYNGVDLYNYGSETYEFQNSVSGLSTTIGVISLIFMILGLIIPFGKLIMVEALAVIQISFFSILGMKKIPTTLLGFKNLIYSTGYNDHSLFNSPTGQPGQTVFELMGFGENVFSNYNVGFVLFFWIPLLVGLIGYLICKALAKKTTMSSKDVKDSLLQTKATIKIGENSDFDFTKKLRIKVFERMLFECSFYGLLISGYLSWVSIFQGFRTLSISNIIASSIIAIVWTIMGITFAKMKTSYTDLKEHTAMGRNMLLEMNSFMVNGFGDFKEIRNQIAKKDTFETGRSEKIYIFFMFQRIVVSGTILYLSSFFDYSSAIIIAIFVIFLIIMIMSYLKVQGKKPKEEQQSLFCHLYNNYVLRQAINFITIIVVQVLITCEQMSLKNSGSLAEVLSINTTTTKMIPMMMLSLILINLIFNIFMWVWELRRSQIIEKSKQVAKLFFEKTSLPKIKDFEEESAKPLKYPNKDSPNSKSKDQGVPDVSMQESIDPTRQLTQQENEMSKVLSSYLQNSFLSKSKNTPFMGFGETNHRKRMVNVPKLPDANQSRSFSHQNSSVSENQPAENVLHDI